MNKTASIFLLFLIAPFFLHAEQFNPKYIDGSEPINPDRLHTNEINRSESRPSSNDRDSYIVLESPSLVGTYTGGGVGSGRGLHIIANEDFTISSLGIYAQLYDKNYLARIFKSSSSYAIDELLHSVEGNPGAFGNMGWNDLLFAEYFSFEAGEYYYLEWSPSDGSDDWCSYIEYFNDAGLPHVVGPLTMKNGVAGQHPNVNDNGFHPYFRIGLEPLSPGCTDPFAINFNEDATADDGSCVYPDNGEYVLSFDGVDDYTHLDWSGNMSTYTVSLWVRANTLSQNRWKSIFNTHDGSNNGWQLDCDGSDNYRMQSALGAITIAPLALEWGHISIVADGQTTRAYFNGDLVETVEWVETDWNRIELGRNRNVDNPGNYTLDQVSIWNVARTQNEIQNDVFNGHHGDEDGLLVYWTADAGEGEILYDHSGNANHATIYGASWVEETASLLVPSISVSPNSIDDELYLGEISQHAITIYNEGDADLNWQINLSNSNSSMVIASSETFVTEINQSPVLKTDDQVMMVNIPTAENIFNFDAIPYTGARAGTTFRTFDRDRDGNLESVLQDIDQNFETITSNIPDMYFFSDGVNGYSIIDGGNDMYDGGNQLSTPSGVILYYSDGLVVSNDNLGQGGSYFTRKYNGLFLFVADINNIPFFEITGNNGADNGGTVNGSVLETTINGKTFYGFVKRVFNAGDPSINHLFIVEANEGLSHEFATNTDNDYHRVFGLENSDRLYYLLYSRAIGGFIDDAQTLVIMEAFLNTIDISPQWMVLSESSGLTLAGESSVIQLTLNAANVGGGDYQGNVSIVSNDYEQPTVDVPVSLTVNIPSPNITLSYEPLDVDLFVGDTASRDIIIGNDGTGDLSWSLSALNSGRNSTSYTFTNCGAIGNTGPAQSDCDDEYIGTTLEGGVTLSGGIQEWSVPQSGLYSIEVFGAQGGGVTNNGIAAGLGSRMSGKFELQAGEVLNILVGQMGAQESNYGGGYAGGGGGGTFITRLPHNNDESILIIAGGGGGSGSYYQGYDAIVETYNSETGAAGYGGFAGGGQGEGNSGAGFYGNGLFGGHLGTSIAYSYINGGVGGVGYSGGGTGYGGFGGGGSDGYADGGGGGGYSGGRTGANLSGGWGGASFNSSQDQENEPGVNEGHGYVVISLETPSWFSSSTNAGTISVGEYDTLKLHYTAVELEPGEYSSTVNIYSNDPDQAEINLNTSLSVSSDAFLADIPDALVMEDETLSVVLESAYADYEHVFYASSSSEQLSALVEEDTLTLIPAPDWTGSVDIEVELTLDNNLSATTDFELSVVPVNDKPYAASEVHNIDEDNFLEIYLDAHDGDLLDGEQDDQGLTFTTIEPFTHGSFSIERNTGMLAYAPNTDYFGPDSMSYLLMDDGTTDGEYDGLSDTGYVRINIIPVNDEPVIQEIEDITMEEDTESEVEVIVSDVDNDDITLSATSSEEEVTTQVIDGVIHINPYFNWNGSAFVTVYANDNMGRAVDVEEFSVTILPVNDPPEFADLYSLVGVGVDFDFILHATDVDLDDLEITFDNLLEYPDWIAIDSQPYRLLGNAPEEGYYAIPLLLSDGQVEVRDTFELEARFFQPKITSVSDVPGDEGGKVYLDFEGSFFDQIDVTGQFYTIFRSDTIEAEPTWVNILNGVANGSQSYTYDVSTVTDSTVSGNGITSFKVVASMNSGSYHSEVVAGYSVDNLSPDAPINLSAIVLEDGISISWDPISADDFQYYLLHKSLTYQFSDFTEHLLLDTVYIDFEFEYNTTNYYRVLAVDNSGNYSEYSEIVDAAVLGVDVDPLPEQYALYQNYPNPFNPFTKIQFDLPENTNVTFRIFDISGKIVKTINLGMQGPGREHFFWDATNQSGETVSAGLYLYMVETDNFTSVRKMLLLK